MIKVSAICSGRILRNLFVCCCCFFFFSFTRRREHAFKLNLANCLCLQHLAMTDNSVVARVSVRLLAIQDIQDAQHSPVGMVLLCGRVGYLPPWEYHQNNRGWGCAESGWGCTWAFNQRTWWDYNAYFRAPPPLQNHVIDFIFKSAVLLAAAARLQRSAGPPSSPAEARTPRCCSLTGILFFFFFKTNEAHRLLPLPLLSVSFSLPANLSFFLTLMPK